MAEPTPKRRRQRVFATMLALLAIIVFVVTPLGIAGWLWTGATGGVSAVAQFLDGRQMGRFGRLSLQNVRESGQDVRIGRLSLSDTQGEWIVARDVELQWQARALVSRRLEINRLGAQDVAILRRPVLRPPGRRRQQPIDVMIRNIALPVALSPNIVRGVGAMTYSLGGDIITQRNQALEIRLVARSRAAANDQFNINIIRPPSAPFQVDLRATGGPNGLVTGLFGAPSAPQTRLIVTASGDLTSGNARLNLTSADSIGGDMNANWTGQAGRASGFIAPAPLSNLGQALSRFGGRIDLDAQGGPSQNGQRGVSISTNSAGLNAQFAGDVDFSKLDIRNGAKLTIQRADLGILSKKRIAGLGMGVFDIDGRLGGLIGGLKGDLIVTSLRGLGVSLDKIVAPVNIGASASTIDVKATVKNQRLQATDARLSRLGTGSTLDLALSQDRATDIWTISKADFKAQGANANLRGRFGRDVREISGRARLGDVAILTPLLSGGAVANVDLRQNGNAPWLGKASLRSERLSSRDQTLNRLIANQLSLDITPSAARNNDGFDWSLTTGAANAQGSANFGEIVPVRGNWSLKSPFTVAGVTVSAGTRSGAAGQVAYGPAGIALASQNARIAIGGWTLDRASALLVGGMGGQPLRARVEGIAPLGPAFVTLAIAPQNGQVLLTDIVGRHAGLQATGSGRNRAGMFDALFDLTLEPGAVLASGTSAGKLGVAVRGGRVGIAADMGFDQARLANTPLEIVRGRLQARGLLSDIAVGFDGNLLASGQASQLSLNGKADIDGRETSLVLNGGGMIGGQRFALIQPLRAAPLGTQARLTTQALWGDYRLGLDGQVRGSGVDVRFVELSGPALSARLAGRIAGNETDLRGNARATNLGAISDRMRGSAQGVLSVRNTGTGGWTAQLRGEANGLSVGSRDADMLLGSRPTFDLTARAVQGRPLTGAWALRGQKLTGEGNVVPATAGGLPDVQGTWRIAGPATLGGLDIVGDVGGDVRLRSGALYLVAGAPRLTVAGQTFTDVRATSRIANILSLGEIPIDLVGAGALGPLGIKTTFLLGTVPRLQPLIVTYGGVEGRGALMLGTGGATGTLQLTGNPGGFLTAGNAAGSVTLLAGARGPEINGQLAFTNATYQSAGISALNGTISARGPFNDLSASINTQFALRGEAAAARLNGQVRQLNSATNILVNGEGTYQGAPWRLSEPLTILAQNGSTRATGKAIWRSASLGFNATFEPARLRLVGTLDDAPAALFNQGGQRFEGRLSGTVRLNGQGNDFDGEGELNAVGLRPANADRRQAVDGSITASLRDGALVIRGNAANPSGLRANGDARLTAATRLTPFRLQISRTAPIEGRFDLAGPVEAIAKLTLSRNSTATGNVSARGELSGTVAAPSIRGRGEIKDASLRDASLGIRITEANAAINFLGPIGDIETFSASDGRGGRLQLGGRIAFAQGVDWRLSGEMTRFQLIGSSQATIVATGPWSVASTGRRTTLGGDLVLDRAQIGIPNPTNRSDALRAREINRPANLPPPPTFNDARQESVSSVDQRVGNSLVLDLKLVSRGNARVLGRGLDAYFDLDVGVRGPLQKPIITGRADLTEGRFDLAGRSFDMTRGNVRFLTPLEATRLDFVAERQSADITALAKIQGTLGRPAFVLESTPPLPQDEILSRMLFGRNVAALTIPQATQLALGLSSLATGTQLNPADRLGQALGLERFSLGTEGGGFSGFTAGLRLVRDVYVEVTTGGEDGTVTMLEWRPRPRVQVQVTTSQNRDSSVSVRLRSKD